MNKILQKNPEEICREYLEMLDNKGIKIELENDAKTSMYVFLTNTIYISTKRNKRQDEETQNKSKLLVTAHECAHSAQKRMLQVLNFSLTNLEMILFLIVLAFGIFFKINIYLKGVYLCVATLSILIRWYLEMDATIKSVKIVDGYLQKNNINKGERRELYLFYKKKLLLSMPLFITGLFLFKIIRIVFVIII